MLVGIKVIRVALVALSGRDRLGDRCGAADKCAVIDIMTVGAGAGLPGRDGAVDLTTGSEWRRGGVVAALAVSGGAGWALGGQDTCRVVVLMSRETGVQTMAVLAVAGAYGGDVTSGCWISH